MQLFGMEPITAVIVITTLGVGIQIGLGYLKNTEPFDARKVIASSIISVFTAFFLVIPLLQALPEDAADLVQLSTFAMAVATVAGIDTLVKNTGKAILAKKKG